MFGDLSFSSFAASAVNAIAQDPAVSGYLYDIGKQLASDATKNELSDLINDFVGIARQRSSALGQVVEQIVMPLARPFITGVRDGLLEATSGILLATGAGLVGVFLLGRVTKKCKAP